MTLFTLLENFADAIADRLMAVIGLRSNLTTTEKGTIVGAINEVKAQVSANGATINDTTPTNASTFSSNKIESRLTETRAALKGEILGTVSPAMDTLQEIIAIINSNDTEADTALAALLTSVGNKVAFDTNTQGLTAPQKQNARTNIGAYSLDDAVALDLAARFTARFTS